MVEIQINKARIRAAQIQRKRVWEVNSCPTFGHCHLLCQFFGNAGQATGRPYRQG